VATQVQDESVQSRAAGRLVIARRFNGGKALRNEQSPPSGGRLKSKGLQCAPYVPHVLQPSLPLRLLHQKPPIHYSSRSKREIVAIHGGHRADEQIQGIGRRGNAGSCASPAFVADDDDALQGNPVNQADRPSGLTIICRGGHSTGRMDMVRSR